MKRRKLQQKYTWFRFFNIVIISMHLIPQYFIFLALVTTLGQEKLFSMIIKSFVTLGFMTTVDNMFV